MFRLKKRGMPVLLAVALLLLTVGCGTPAASSKEVSGGEQAAAREVSRSPDGRKKILHGPDNNLVLADAGESRVIYRRYEREDALFNHPYSLWSCDFFRIQWSADSRYVYIIDRIYDLEGDRFIPLKDCLIFSWAGNRGVFLTKGVLYEGRFWDHGFYGLYVSKQVKLFEDGRVRVAKTLADDRHFVVMEEDWRDGGETLFKRRGNAVEVRTAKLRYGEEALHEKILKAYQTVREDEEAWAVLSGEYGDAAACTKALEKFAALEKKYPLKLLEEPVSNGHINWEFEMRFYLLDTATDDVL